MANYKFGTQEPPHRRWPIAWYNPAVLLRSAREMVASDDLIRNFDRRELFAGKFEAIDLSQMSAAEDYWWDFMSDSGDGGNASYCVAKAMQTAGLDITPDDEVTTPVPHRLPAGKLLILGGDLAYPGANTEEYQYRFIELWEAARPSAETTPPTVASIPQNHDWFDNISSFSRHFIGDYKNHFLKAYTPQTRSYFAIQLPYDWWVFGFDFALVVDLDRAQFEGFLTVIQTKLKYGDNVVLIYPEPYWTRPLGDNARPGYPKRYQRLEAALMDYGIKIRIRIAGDLHHYVREIASEGAGLEYDDMLITCGTGGAFLHPTHAKRVNKSKIMDRVCESCAITTDLEKRVRVGIHDRGESDMALTPDQRLYDDKVCYPDQKTSKKLSYGNVWALFKVASLSGLFTEKVSGSFAKRAMFRVGELVEGIRAGNIMFSVLLGFLYLLAVYCNSFVFSESFVANGFIPSKLIQTISLPHFLSLWFKALFYSPLALGVHIILLVLCGSIAHEDGFKTGLFGALYGMLHIFAAATIFWLACHITTNPYYKGLLVIPGGIIAGGLIFGSYFALMARWGYLANNAFSALGHQGYKGFLRFRIDGNGDLHGYMIGTDNVPKRWKLNPHSKRPLWIEKYEKDAPVWKVRDSFVLKK